MFFWFSRAVVSLVMPHSLFFCIDMRLAIHPFPLSPQQQLPTEQHKCLRHDTRHERVTVGSVTDKPTGVCSLGRHGHHDERRHCGLDSFVSTQPLLGKSTIKHITCRIKAFGSITMATRILPLELIDKAIGSQIWILLRGTKEVVGILRGFDDYVSYVLWTRESMIYNMVIDICACIAVCDFTPSDCEKSTLTISTHSLVLGIGQSRVG